MLEVHLQAGNIFRDREFEHIKSEEHDVLKMSRMELERRILRRRTQRGIDIGLNLDHGIKLCHGDVIKDGDNVIVVEQIPEKVISVRIKNKDMHDVMILLGHIIGNRHRPISVQNDEIFFPIQANSEEEVFTKLFDSIIKHIEIKVEERIFLPHMAADVHGH